VVPNKNSKMGKYLNNGRAWKLKNRAGAVSKITPLPCFNNIKIAYSMIEDRRSVKIR